MAKIAGMDFSSLTEGLAALDKAGDTEPKPVLTGSVDLPLKDVIEDPNNPRQTFNEDELKELAASIKERGVVQPIIVRPINEDGKYVIIMGARRTRASRMCAATTIPAVIRVKKTDRFDQMIENIQRADLSHSDIAAFIADAGQQDFKPAQIAKALGKSPAWVTLYRGFADMHEAIKARVDGFGMRAAYDLQKAMELDEDRTLAFLAENEQITQAMATSFFRNLKAAPESTSESGGVGEPVLTSEARRSPDKSQREPTPKKPRITVLVSVNGRQGWLVLDRLATAGIGFAIVSFGDDEYEEIDVSNIQITEVSHVE